MIFIIGVIAVIYALTVGYIIYELRNHALAEGWKLVKTATAQKARDIEVVLNEDLVVSRALAFSMKAIVNLPKKERDAARKQIMTDALLSNPKYQAVWMSFEMWTLDPDWDKPYGRESAAYYIEDGKVAEQIRFLNLDGDPTAGLYIDVKKGKKEVLSEPYYFGAYGEGNDKVLLAVSPTSPILIDGRYAGLIATDMFLDGFSTMSSIDLYDRGFAFLVSNQGVVVAHADEKMTNQPLDSLSFMKANEVDVKSRIATGESFIFSVSDPYFDNEEVMLAFAPIHVGHSDTPWAVGLEIPVKEIVKPVTKALRTALITGALGLLLVIGITYKISEGIASSIEKSRDLLQKLSVGDLDPGNELKVTQEDELGHLAKAANNLMTELTKKSTFARQIGMGNLDVQFEVSGNRDMLGHSLLTMRSNLQKVIADLNTVIKKAGDEGMFSSKVESDWEEGAWKDLSDSINRLLESVAKPYVEINKVVVGMANGDFTERFSGDYKGDVKHLGESLNTALDRIRELLHSILRSAATVKESATELLTVNEEMVINTREIASSIAQMSSGAQNQVVKVDESSNLVEGILRSSNEMGAQADSINSAAQTGARNSETGLNLVKKVGYSIRDIAAFSSDTYDSIQVLTLRSNEISKVLSVITDIAAQTNLLALNAAIEAAQAGEAGRGFAVVAEEIRKLAEDSKGSASEIEKLIRDVQNDVKTAGSAIDMMKNSVKSGEEASNEASSAFEEITSSSSKTLRMAEEIQKRVKQQLESIKTVVSITETVVVIAEETAAGSEQIASSASELSAGMQSSGRKSEALTELANELHRQITQFKLSKG